MDYYAGMFRLRTIMSHWLYTGHIRPQDFYAPEQKNLSETINPKFFQKFDFFNSIFQDKFFSTACLQT